MASARKIILIVDDDPDIRELARHALTHAGYEVEMAADAPAARELMAVHAPDLIVSDIRMPVESGTEFVAGLRQDPSLARIPVIYLTAMEEDAELAVRTVGYPLLSKPLKTAELLKLVKAQLGAAPAPR